MVGMVVHTYKRWCDGRLIIKQFLTSCGPPCSKDSQVISSVTHYLKKASSMYNSIGCILGGIGYGRYVGINGGVTIGW